ncbi:hypothetical protein ISN45_Aa03g008480 [Arabidopsis thaliana x Arabidopsis arenosa]|uniref:Uncharacterized protein n=1 Tax=Arabidopsis thaliana x Arabidopsis arenosa TaxID=1240361 RepID=A0A8T2ATF5_9BRAS|nr:hypothetical protein ISN45_Aa03g008480 [Arabidopsis thaliana x Arabidopsis arenosa]
MALLSESKVWTEKQIPMLQFLKKVNISQNSWPQEESAEICFFLRRHLHLHLDCEEPELVGRKMNHGVFIRLHSMQKQRKCSKCWMFKFRKKNIDQWLGYSLIATSLEKTWTVLRVTKHDNLSWKEDASDESRSRSSCCIVKLGGAAITSKNVLEKIYDENLEIVDWSKRPGRSEFICEVDDFGDQESSKFRKFVVEFTDLSTVAKTQDVGFVHVLHKDAVLDSILGCTILSDGQFLVEKSSVNAANWSTQMVFGSASYHMWHRWKARYSQNFDNRVWDPGG